MMQIDVERMVYRKTIKSTRCIYYFTDIWFSCEVGGYTLVQWHGRASE